jgi:hypothetical protein
VSNPNPCRRSTRTLFLLSYGSILCVSRVAGGGRGSERGIFGKCGVEFMGQKCEHLSLWSPLAIFPRTPTDNGVKRSVYPLSWGPRGRSKDKAIRLSCLVWAAGGGERASRGRHGRFSRHNEGHGGPRGLERVQGRAMPIPFSLGAGFWPGRQETRSTTWATWATRDKVNDLGDLGDKRQGQRPGRPGRQETRSTTWATWATRDKVNDLAGLTIDTPGKPREP